MCQNISVAQVFAEIRRLVLIRATNEACRYALIGVLNLLIRNNEKCVRKQTKLIGRVLILKYICNAYTNQSYPTDQASVKIVVSELDIILSHLHLYFRISWADSAMFPFGPSRFYHFLFFSLSSCLYALRSYRSCFFSRL